MYHRFLVYVSVAALISLGLLYELCNDGLDGTTEKLKAWIPDWQKHGDEEYRYRPRPSNETAIDEYIEETNTTLPKMTLVLATLSYTDNSWIDTQLSDLLGEAGNLYTAIYVVNNLDSPLHTPANKGHEAMAYLSYIIDFYHDLPEISVFMHGHAEAWHNNYLLDMSSSKIIRHLNREKVVREGYFNLRCHWSPGCPEHLHPKNAVFDVQKQEEVQIKSAWEALFDGEEVPEVLSQACCSQFAVSRDAIHRLPREKYVEIRDWLLQTPLNDYVAGRIFEYLWQFMFNRTPIFCPDPRICYCDGYGVCFEDPNGYIDFFDEVTRVNSYRKELEAWGHWNTHARREEAVPGDPWKSTKIHVSRDEIVPGGPDAVKHGKEERIKWLEEEVERMVRELDEKKMRAMEVGRDREGRERVLEGLRDEIMENPKDGPPFWTKRDVDGGVEAGMSYEW